MNSSLKIPYIAHACLAHMVRHWTPKPVIICSIRSSPTGGNFFFAVVKSFEYKIAISANFVQTVKNSTVNECDWQILVGNHERINSHCLTRFHRFPNHKYFIFLDKGFSKSDCKCKSNTTFVIFAVALKPILTKAGANNVMCEQTLNDLGVEQYPFKHFSI